MTTIANLDTNLEPLIPTHYTVDGHFNPVMATRLAVAETFRGQAPTPELTTAVLTAYGKALHTAHAELSALASEALASTHYSALDDYMLASQGADALAAEIAHHGI